ncbi:hypothetical protein Poli38472_003564 [Pythium oligandrum]|uniref:START-like domain n=1 Tax=Pythium oligandrum TaxID=41045 RepID=A0A8K1C6R8_PYTOL|nr:hypothetical protein Poli38472_003564 [Pythium oligandrum]|eukprot:TMW57639.1 hypothetical protein Poli38472_003564 [Pythium oligandrum]
MKFPLEIEPFAPVEATPERIAELENLAHVLLNETIVEWDHFVHVQNRVVDKKRWKHVQTRENTTVYKDMHHGKSDPVPQYPGTPSTVGAGSGLRLLSVGTMVGNLEDFMLGTTTTTTDQMRIRRSYNDDECVDYRVLNVWREPTVDDPFVVHSLRWYVKEVRGVNAIVKSRDLVLLDCAGIHQMPNGERLGYIILHSVDVPECREIPGLIRCQLSACYIFRQSGSNSVEVYLRSMVEPGGKIIDSLATFSSAIALISTWKLPWVGQNRKLTWMMTQPASVRAEMLGKAITATKSARKDKCSLCLKRITLLRRVSACELCMDSVCSRCLTVRKLSYIRRNGDLVQVPTAFCKNCIMWSTNLDASEVGRALSVYHERKSSVEVNLGLVKLLSAQRNTTSTTDEGCVSQELEAGNLHVETEDEWERRQALGRSPSSSTGSESAQDVMMMQMNQLVLAAEQAYQMTQQNTEAMAQSMHSLPKP